MFPQHGIESLQKSNVKDNEESNIFRFLKQSRLVCIFKSYIKSWQLLGSCVSRENHKILISILMN